MIIFSPGPANISERVRAALTLPDISHRDPDFTAVLAEVRASLLRACGAPASYESVVLAGSGTAAIEGALGALRGVVQRVLIVANGVYGERAAAIADVIGLPAALLRFTWGEAPDLARLAAAAAAERADALYVVHHETTTGVLNPLREVAALARDRGWALAVDGISSVAGEDLDPGWGIDLLIGSANKCMRGVPGVAFVVASPRMVERIAARSRGTYYTDLPTQLDAQRRGTTPFTPPVQVLYALREALRELLEEGVAARIEGYRALARHLREGLAGLGLSLYPPDARRSNTMTCVELPPGWTYERLHAALKRRGFVIYPSQGPLYETTFRLGTVGLIPHDAITAFLGALREILAAAPT